LTVDIVKEYKKNFMKYSYCKNIGEEDVKCCFLECGKCIKIALEKQPRNNVKGRERKKRKIFTYGV
jgi:hypothetical protein